MLKSIITKLTAKKHVKIDNYLRKLKRQSQFLKCELNGKQAGKQERKQNKTKYTDLVNLVCLK